MALWRSIYRKGRKFFEKTKKFQITFFINQSYLQPQNIYNSYLISYPAWSLPKTTQYYPKVRRDSLLGEPRTLGSNSPRMGRQGNMFVRPAPVPHYLSRLYLDININYLTCTFEEGKGQKSVGLQAYVYCFKGGSPWNSPRLMGNISWLHKQGRIVNQY